MRKERKRKKERDAEGHKDGGREEGRKRQIGPYLGGILVYSMVLCLAKLLIGMACHH